MFKLLFSPILFKKIYRQTLFDYINFISFLTSFSFCLDTKRNKKIKKFRNSLRSNSGISGLTLKISEFSKKCLSKNKKMTGDALKYHTVQLLTKNFKPYCDAQFKIALKPLI